MLSLRLAATAALLLATTVQAHFELQYPGPIKPFDDDTEGSAPCGGYTPDLDNENAVDFHVDGDAISTYSTHPQTNWLYRMTTDPTASGNWSQVYGIIQQSGPGNYCTPQVTISHEYVGKKAILSMVASGIDGLLYQCAAVNFINGTGNAPSVCTNQSSVKGSYTNDATLTALLGSSSASSASSSASPSETPGAGVSMRADSVEGLRALVATGVMVVVGAMLMV
ncbi:Uu.00g061910.m01.CDS01 [Anthostomella pinea]|uniref:Uu.00g061910.m01.CDS01 n=1 Tax=Anthostomella pinea TaxID=933095 RepID=A0AAI8YK68_9PEZI|nr:Uu.00g061910.m01.CDS01 [Anthostomella pinea]